MLDCPYCHHKEVIGALFCSECGTQLIDDDSTVAQRLQENFTPQTNNNDIHVASDSSSPINHKITTSLFIINSGDKIPLEGKDEYTLGRNSEGQAVISDVDLTEYQGYELGVSRLHASIKITEDQVFATDLGSANGTRINGQDIPSFEPNLLQHGDIITLGKLKIQMLIDR